VSGASVELAVEREGKGDVWVSLSGPLFGPTGLRLADVAVAVRRVTMRVFGGGGEGAVAGGGAI